MAYWDRERRGPEEKDLDAPYPSRQFKPDVKLTVTEDEIRAATIDRVAYAQSQAGNSGVALANSDVVI